MTILRQINMCHSCRLFTHLLNLTVGFLASLTTSPASSTALSLWPTTPLAETAETAEAAETFLLLALSTFLDDLRRKDFLILCRMDLPVRPFLHGQKTYIDLKRFRKIVL